MENKGVLLTYHYRNVPEDKRPDLVTRAETLIREAGFNIGQAHCALEVSINVVILTLGNMCNNVI